MTQNLKNKLSLITGASSGLGKDFAYLLAQAGSDVVLVARRKERLLEIKKNLEHTFNITAHVVDQDLTSPGAAQTLSDAFPHVDILINNAGYGLFGEFATLKLNEQLGMIDLNIKALTELSFLYGQKMKKNQTGYILNIASIIGFWPAPLYSVYAATKSYVLAFSEGLHHELKPHGVAVTAFSPGTTGTEFFERSGQRHSPLIEKMKMNSMNVAQMALLALFKRQQGQVAGFLNQALVFSGRFLPRKLQAKWVHFLLARR